MRPGRKLATAYFALAGILAGLLPLAGCSAAGEEWSLKIEGGFGAPVSITTTGQARLSDTRVSIESSGDGVEISSGARFYSAPPPSIRALTPLCMNMTLGRYGWARLPRIRLGI